MKKALSVIIFTMAIIVTASSSYAGQGCCSHHGGQAGCSGGKVLCTDGTLSPTCGC